MPQLPTCICICRCIWYSTLWQSFFVVVLIGKFPCRVGVPPRRSARQLVARGLFPGARVVRGEHWRWGDQDGEQWTPILGQLLYTSQKR